MEITTIETLNPKVKKLLSSRQESRLISIPFLLRFSKTKDTALPKYFSLFTFLILLAFNTNAQTNLTTNPNLEIKSERSMYAKVFLKPNGKYEAILSPAPVHYKKNGAWEEINTKITRDDAGYKNESNVIQSYFPNNINGLDKIKLIVNSNDQIFIHSEKKLVLLNDQTNSIILASNSNNSIANVANNTINYSAIYTGISDEFTILNGEIKNNVVLNAPPTLLNNISSGYFGFQEIVELPQGWKITMPYSTVNGLTSSSLSIVDSKNSEVLSIPEPVFFDNYGPEPDGANMVEGKYLVMQENNCWTITTLVPVTWLKDVNTKYPISIDPTVVIAGNTGGWQSPNNFVDNPAFVFIGVCCGNLTHRAWIKFNVSSIPTNSCITNVEIEPDVTTVVANTPELVLMNDVTGAFGPYGAIVPAAYTDFGNGFYTSFTITGVGLYGYYSLGANANALLQAQLPGGWFQVAFQFSNEPSTDYKIMTATSSNLRVTYNAPPCVVLPIDLISFDAKCDDSKVNLNWETASQTNNDHFTIERSANGIDYKTIGTVAGAGNSSSNLNYSFTDESPTNGINYYRLSQTDFDGKSVSYNVTSCNITGKLIGNVYPNPSTGEFSIAVDNSVSEIQIYNTIGQKIYDKSLLQNSGNTLDVDLSSQTSGVYILNIIQPNHNSKIVKKLIVYPR
jgi:hypothetical protein